MSHFVENPIDFSANCAWGNGHCAIVRENVLFLDDGEEQTAVSDLQMECGHVVIIPDRRTEGQALLYHTSCQRMTDLVNQIFPEQLEAPVHLPQHDLEMTLGELQCQRVAISYEECKERVARFSF